MRLLHRPGRASLALLLVFGLLAAACGGDDDAAPSAEPQEPEVSEPAADEPEVSEPAADEPEVSEPAADEPEVSEPAADEREVSEPAADEPMEPVTLRVSAWKGGGTEIANVPELHDKFEAENPDIKIQFEFNGRGDHETVNNTQLAAGEAADVIMVDEGLMHRWASEGLLEDLSGESWVGNILPEVARFTQVDGKTYQFPQELVPIGLFTNNDLLAQAGINELPQTWDEFVASLETLEAAGISGLLLNGAEWGGYQLLALSAAGTVYRDNPDWSQDYKDGSASFNPDWTPAFGRLQELLQAGLVDGQLMASGLPDSLFVDGEYAYLVNGAWMYGGLTNAGLDFNFMPLPSDSAPHGFIFVGTGLAANAASEHKDAARRYIEFWSQPDNLVRFTEGENALTTISNGETAFAAESAPWADAVAEGNWTFAPPQSLSPPNQEGEFYPTVGMLYQDPGMDTGELMDILDSVITPD